MRIEEKAELLSDRSIKNWLHQDLADACFSFSLSNSVTGG